jgi:hypothetical protein
LNIRCRLCACILVTPLCCLAGGCDSESDRYPLLVSIPSVGLVRTGEFEIRAPRRYDVSIGVKPVQTDEATCRAAIPSMFGRKLEIPGSRPCTALAPPMGAVDWILKQSGKVVASGSAPGYAWEWPNSYPQSPVYWRRLDRIPLYPGSHYVLELNIHPPPVPIKQYSASLQVLSPVK